MQTGHLEEVISKLQEEIDLKLILIPHKKLLE